MNRGFVQIDRNPRREQRRRKFAIRLFSCLSLPVFMVCIALAFLALPKFLNGNDAEATNLLPEEQAGEVVARGQLPEAQQVLDSNAQRLEEIRNQNRRLENVATQYENKVELQAEAVITQQGEFQDLVVKYNEYANRVAEITEELDRLTGFGQAAIERRAELEAELVLVQGEIATLEATLADAEQIKATVEGNIQTVQTEIEIADKQHTELAAGIVIAQEENNQLVVDLNTVNTENEILTGEVAEATETQTGLTTELGELEESISATNIAIEGAIVQLDETQIRAATLNPVVFSPVFVNAEYPDGTRLLSQETVESGEGIEADMTVIEGFYYIEVSDGAGIDPDGWDTGVAVPFCNWTVRIDWNSQEGIYTEPLIQAPASVVSRGVTYYPADWANLITIQWPPVYVREDEINGMVYPAGFLPTDVKTRVFLLVEVTDSWRLDSGFCPLPIDG
jgi:predicted  nucleic acid-binding Zn-ribbon protein